MTSSVARSSTCRAKRTPIAMSRERPQRNASFARILSIGADLTSSARVRLSQPQSGHLRGRHATAPRVGTCGDRCDAVVCRVLCNAVVDGFAASAIFTNPHSGLIGRDDTSCAATFALTQSRRPAGAAIRIRLSVALAPSHKGLLERLRRVILAVDCRYQGFFVSADRWFPRLGISGI